MSRHNHDMALRDEVRNLILDRMGANFCTPCAAQALINVLSEVMTTAIRKEDAELSVPLAGRVAEILEKMAAIYRGHEATAPAHLLARTH